MWFILGVIFLIFEIVSFNTIMIWFSIAAFITSFFSYLSLYYQFIIFSFSSAITLLFFRKILTTFFKNESEIINKLDNKIGIISYKNGDIYYVDFEGKNWRAISEEKFFIYEKVKITGIIGNKLILKKITKTKEE